MAYTIRMVDCNDWGTAPGLRMLFAAAYDGKLNLPEKFLANQLDSKASMRSFFLVAEEDSQIIGCNGFLANEKEKK